MSTVLYELNKKKTSTMYMIIFLLQSADLSRLVNIVVTLIQWSQKATTEHIKWKNVPTYLFYHLGRPLNLTIIPSNTNLF